MFTRLVMRHPSRQDMWEHWNPYLPGFHAAVIPAPPRTRLPDTAATSPSEAEEGQFEGRGSKRGAAQRNIPPHVQGS